MTQVNPPSISKKFDLTRTNTRHPRHDQYVGLPTLDRSLEQVLAFRDKRVSEDDRVKFFQGIYLDQEATSTFLHTVKEGDLLGVEFFPYEVTRVLDTDPTDPEDEVLEVIDLSPHYVDDIPLESVRKQARRRQVSAGTVGSQLLVGRAEILYRDQKPFGIPEKESFNAEVVMVKDEDGNEVPVLKVTPKKNDPGAENLPAAPGAAVECPGDGCTGCG